MKTIHSLVFYIGGNFELMAQKVNTNKERKENQLSEKKKNGIRNVFDRCD